MANGNNTVMTLSAERLQKAKRFLGYGDPQSAKIWFVGLEEHDQFERPEDIDTKLPNSTFLISDVKESGRTPIYEIMSKIVTGLLGQDWRADWWGYMFNRLFRAGGEAVQANLYPFGKSTFQCWPRLYKAWLGMTHDRYYQWIATEETGRFPLICTERARYGDPLTVCFGQSAGFRQCFNLTPMAGNPFEFHDLSRIILTPFFRYSLMSNDRIHSLIRQINERGMNPFQQQAGR